MKSSVVSSHSRYSRSQYTAPATRLLHAITKAANRRSAVVLAGSFASLTLVHELHAANSTWSNTATNFNDAGSWSVLPTSADLGVFGSPVTNQPQLTASTSIQGLAFTVPGWTLSSNSSANILTIGSAGITTTGTGNTTVSANIGLSATQNWTANSPSVQIFTGNITNGTSVAGSAANRLIITTGGTGSFVINPSAGNSVAYYGNSTSASVIAFNANTSLGSGANSTSSTNYIVNVNGMGGTTETNAFSVLAGRTLTINSGTWNTNSIGRNSGADMAGNVTLSGGTLAANGGRYAITASGTTGGNWTINGGTLLSTGSSMQSSGGQFGVGGAYTGTITSATVTALNLQSGFVDVARGNAASVVGGAVGGSASGVPSALFNQSGGVAQFGVTATSNVIPGFTVNTGATTNQNLTVGSASTASGAVRAAYTLAGGRLIVAGTLSGVAPGSAFASGTGVSNFNFMGGTLTAGTINATNLGSSPTATATANQTLVSSSVGTLVNYGGTLAPGGSLVTNTPDQFGNANLSFTPTSGRTAITGNYTQTAAGSLSINIGGTTASSAFQDAANSGRFSNITVSGTTALGGTLIANLINGSGGTTFIPATGNSFQVITSTGALSGTFSNVGGKVVLGNDPFSGSLNINYVGGNVTLNGYAANEWLGSGGGNNWGTGGTGVWTNAVDPNAASAGAKFGSAGAANNSITLNANRTVGQLLFSSANYTIGGSNTLTLDNGASASVITVQDATTQTISTPVTLNSDLTIIGFSGGTVSLGALTGAAKNLTANTSGSTLILTGNNTYNNTTIASGVVVNVGNGGTAGTLGSGTVANSGSLIFNRNDSGLIVGSSINGAGNVTQAGAGVTTLNAANGYTGTTTISAGTLKLSGSGTLGASSSTLGAIASGAVLDLNGTNQSIGQFSGTSAGQIQNNSGGGISVLTVGGSGASTFAGLIADNNTVSTGGKVGLALNGTGAVTLSGNSTYSGGTSVGGSSTLFIAGNSFISGGNVTSGVTGTGGVTFANGASVNANSGLTWYTPTITLQGTLNLLGNNRLNLAFKTLDLTSGNRTVNVNGRSVAVTGGSTLGGETTGLSQWEMQNVTTLGTSTIQDGTLNLQTTTFTGQTVGGGTGNYAAMRINNATSFSNADLIIGNNVLLMAANTGTLGNSASTSPNVTVNGILNLVASSANGRTVSVKSLTGTGSIFGSMVASNTNNTTLALNGTSGSTEFSGLISNGPGSGTLALTKSGNSTQTLSGANTYSGNTTISGGTLLVRNTSGSGTGTGQVFVNSGATLGGNGSISGATTLNSGTIGSSGDTLALGSTLATTGSSTLASGATVNVTGGSSITSGTFTVNGTLGGGISVGGVGNTLNGSGTVNGTTSVNGGTIGGTLNLATLVATGNSTIASTVNASSGTTVSSGALTVSGSLGGGAVTIQSGATLKGSGIVNGSTTIDAGAFLSPGNSPGVLEFTNDLTLSGTTVIEIDGTSRGTAYDGINLTGTGSNTLTYGGELSLSFGAAITAGTYDLFQLGSVTQTGDFTSVSASGLGVVSTFTGLTFNGGTGWVANLTDTSSNSWVLTFSNATGDLSITTAVPEPSSYAALAGFATLGLALYRRRRSVKKAA